MTKQKKYYEFKNIATNDYEIYMYGEVSSWDEDINALGFKEELDSIPDGSNITCYINSVGGSVFEGVAIASMIKRKKGTKKCIVDGICASIATTIASAFDTVEAYKNSLYMIHLPWIMCAGNSDDLRKQAEDLDKMTDALVTSYMDKTGIDKDKLVEMMKAETWMTAEQAKEFGFIDNVLEQEKQMVAKVSDKEILKKYKNTPEIDFVEPENKINNDELELLELEIDLM